MKTQKTTSGRKRHLHLFVFLISAAVVLVVGASAYLYSIPPLIYNGIKKGIVQDGLGSGSAIPVNTFYVVPELASPSAKTFFLRTGGNVDTLFCGGWMDLKEKPLVLHVPDMNGRYYSVQLTDPKTGTDFAYVGRRTTGTQAGDYLITGPGWRGSVPPNMKRISSPDNSVLLLGRVLVRSSDDLAATYDLSMQITLLAR
jgi:hypothetical protein